MIEFLHHHSVSELTVSQFEIVKKFCHRGILQIPLAPSQKSTCGKTRMYRRLREFIASPFANLPAGAQWRFSNHSNVSIRLHLVIKVFQPVHGLNPSPAVLTDEAPLPIRPAL